MHRKKTGVLVSALLAVVIGLLFFCERNNPYDPNSHSFIAGKKPHVAFVNKAMSAYLYDTVSIPVIWADTAVGGVRGAIKTWYIEWHGNTLFNDTVAGTGADTMVLKKAFPVGEVTVRIRGLDYDGNTSDADSMKLSVVSSRPRIVTTGGSRTIRKAIACTLSVSASDTGGVIQNFFWAKNGTDFNDSTLVGSFQVSFGDTGAKIVLVKARDNKGVETGVDTFRIAVFDKRGGVFYDGNGNTGGIAPTDTNTYVPGQSVTVLGNTGNLLKSGYVFSGWNTLPNGSGANYSAGATFSMDTASAVLYAQWTANPTFVVVYNGNGSTGGVVPADTANYSIGQSVTVLGNSGSLVKTGNNFVGWNTEANGSGIGYAAGVSFIMGAAGVTLYAQWTADPTYNVTYNGNGNSGGSAPVDGNNYLSDATVKVLDNTGGLVKTGNTFIGWNTKADGSGTAYAAGVSFTIGSASVTLYAQWTALPTYTVTYDGNVSTGGAAPADANNYLQGQTVTARGAGTLVKAGYTFTGWNTKADGTGTGHAVGATFAMGAANVVLYAQWTVIPTYTVTYNGNGNNTGTVPVDNNHYTFGQSVTVLTAGNLAKTGATFVGWNTQANGGGTGYAATVSFVMGSGNVTLFAQWTANPTYTVIYRGNTNSGGTVPVDGNNYLTGATVTVLNSNTLVKTGYTFVGWNTQADGSGTTYASQATFVMGSASITLYARWTALPTYTVIYNGGSGSTGTAPVDNNSYLQGQTVTTRGAGTLVKAGYTFSGWNTQANGSGFSYAAGVTFAIGAANDTLHAQWASIPTYTVSYNGNTNTTGTAPADNNRYTSGQPVIALGNTGNLVKTGFTFVGWNTQAGGNGIGYAAGVSFVMGSSSVILYAQWTADPTYTVTYNGNTNTSGNVPVDANNYRSGATVTVPGNTGALVKSGYTFIGWDTVASGGGTVLGASFTMKSANVTLYAQWTAKTTYTVIYNSNNTGGSVPVDGKSYLPGATVTVLGNTGPLVKPGYTFAGWDTIAGGGTVFTPGDTFTMKSAIVTLYAQWVIIPTYTVTYDGNGNTSGSAPADNNKYTVGQSVIALGKGSLAKTNNQFVGWNTRVNGSGIGYATGISFFMGSANDTLYAQWTANPTYNVTYNGNTNSSGSVPIDPNNYQSGDSVTVLGNPGALDKAGYFLVGWNTQADGLGTTYSSSIKFKIGAANVTLYATWTANATYTVTYDGNGSIDGTKPTDANRYMQGQMVTTLNVGTLARTGYTFAGWNTQSDGTGTAYAAGETFSMGTTSVILYAQWTAIPKHTVTYNRNTATSGNVPVDTNHYTFGQSVTVLGDTGNLVKTGFTFVGWNTKADGSGIGYVTAGTSFLMGSANDTLFAQWSADPTYTVTYNGNTNTSGTVPVDAGHYLTGATVTLLGNAGGLVKTGFNFAGWDTIAIGGGTVLGASFTMGSVNVTLYAQWTAKTTYTVTYLGNDSTGGNVPVDGNRYLTGATVTVRNKGTLVRTGCVFAGWNTQTDGLGTLFAPGDTFPMGGSNVTLYAKWVVTITASAGANGSISPLGAVTVIAGTNKTYTITPAANYHVANVIVSGVSVGAVTSYTFHNVNADSTISAAFAINVLTITVSQGANGAISPAGPVSVNATDNSPAFTITPDANYHIVGVFDNSSLVGAVTSYTVNNVTVNHTITATFAINIHTITVTHGANGTISPAGPVSVNATDNSPIFSITPASNYHVANVIVGGVSVGAVTSYTFHHVIADSTISATFAINTFTITASAGSYGTISPSGSVTVDTGANQAFSITPDANYHVDTVKVNGLPIGAVPSYTFYSVGADSSISASFAINPYSVTYDGNGNDLGTNPPVDSNLYVSGQTATVLGQASLLKSGFAFDGWNTQSDSLGTNVSPGSGLTITGSVTLFAKWK